MGGGCESRKESVSGDHQKGAADATINMLFGRQAVPFSNQGPRDLNQKQF